MITLTLWLPFAFLLGLGARHIGLPPLVGYLIAGFILSAMGHTTSPILEQLAHAGVLLLLFSVGLKLRLRTLIRAEVMAGSLLHMAIMIVLTAVILYGFAGVSIMTALFIAAALSFSSTVIAAKVLESRKELRAFHGRVSIGILIVQDIVAVILMSTLGDNTISPWAFLILGIFLLRPILHWLLDLSGHDELLILYGLLLAMVVGGGGFEYVGLSSELGALMLGIILADHKRAVEVSNALWGLKEIMLVGFFLQIGIMGHPTWETLGTALLLCLLLPVKVIFFFFVLLLFRLRARSSFLTGLVLATFSEFGLIVAEVGRKHNMIDQEWLTILSLTVAISFALIAPILRNSHNIYGKLEGFLVRFQSEKRHPDDMPIHLGSAHFLVMGMGRIGTGAYDFFVRQGLRVVGFDSDPAKAEKHREGGRRVLYADSEDPEFWQNIHLEGLEAILLTMPDINTKLTTIKRLRQSGFDGIIAASAVYPEEDELIAQAGANLAHNYYEGAGNSFAEHTWHHLYPGAQVLTDEDPPREQVSSST